MKEGKQWMGDREGQTTGFTAAQQYTSHTPSSLNDPNTILKSVGDTAFSAQ